LAGPGQGGIRNGASAVHRREHHVQAVFEVLQLLREV
jgi:hypothetical protein